jgi:pyridoxal 5'-phosphate synthase pdxS subunit
VRFIVPATSSPASPGHDAARPGASQAGDATATGFQNTAAGGAAAGTSATAGTSTVTGTARVKRGMADMLKGGVIMDVVTPDQAKIAEDAGAVAVMALERVPADIRAQGGVARMSDPDMIDQIIGAVSIPVMAKCRIGHLAEAQVLQAIGVDYVDESEVLTPADEANHVDKWAFTVPFVCGATNLGEPHRRGRGDDQVQGRGGHRQRGGGHPAHAADRR